MGFGPFYLTHVYIWSQPLKQKRCWQRLCALTSGASGNLEGSSELPGLLPELGQTSAVALHQTAMGLEYGWGD